MLVDQWAAAGHKPVAVADTQAGHTLAGVARTLAAVGHKLVEVGHTLAVAVRRAMDCIQQGEAGRIVAEEHSLAEVRRLALPGVRSLADHTRTLGPARAH